MIKLFKPTIKRKDMDSVLNTMVDEALGPGIKNRELGKALCHEIHADESIVIRSYLRALTLALKTLQLKRGDRVMISPLSPPCYVWVLQDLELDILFADVDPRTGCMLIDDVKSRLDRSPAAILLHEPLGNIVDAEAFKELSIPIIEDITQSLHSKKHGQVAGALGDVVVVSFEDDSLLCAGGGAAVLVKEKKHVAFLKKASARDLRYDLLPDINCALVLNQLNMVEQHIERRLEYFELYRQSVMKTRHQIINEHGEEISHNAYSLALLLDSRVKDVIRYAVKYKIETLMPFQECAIHLTDAETTDFPNSIPFILRAIIFPLYPLLSKDQLMTLVRVLSTLP